MKDVPRRTILCTKGRLSKVLDRSNKVNDFNEFSEISGQQNIRWCDLEVKEVRPITGFRCCVYVHVKKNTLGICYNSIKEKKYMKYYAKHATLRIN